MKALSKDSSKEEEELDDLELTDPFTDLQVGFTCTVGKVLLICITNLFALW
jgi:hypothetical protein